jgi:hypothetical protein
MGLKDQIGRIQPIDRLWKPPSTETLNTSDNYERSEIMRASEIVNYVAEQIALRKKAKAQTTVSTGGKAVPNRPLKGKKRRPYMGPVMALVELPRPTMLMDETKNPKK